MGIVEVRDKLIEDLEDCPECGSDKVTTSTMICKGCFRFRCAECEYTFGDFNYN